MYVNMFMSICCTDLLYHVESNTFYTCVDEYDSGLTVIDIIVPVNHISLVICHCYYAMVLTPLLPPVTVTDTILSSGVSTSLHSRANQSFCCDIPPAPIIMGYWIYRYGIM